jgi:hypothetical protein
VTEVGLHEQNTAWDLRAAWANNTRVRVTLSEACMLKTIVGKVSRVAVTGAFVVIDGWHIPTDQVRGIGKPTNEDSDAYAQALRQPHVQEALK